MLNYQLEIVGDGSVTSFDEYEGFHVNLLFDRSIYRPMSTHIMGYIHTTWDDAGNNHDAEN